MKYISIGAVTKPSTEHIVYVSHCGYDYTLTGEQAALWLDGRYGFDAVSGPVGVAGEVGGALKDDLQADPEKGQSSNNLLYLAMIITVNLGVMNLLPIPALDGGRLFFQLVELVFRRPIPTKYEGYIHGAGIIILMAFMALVALKDTIGLFS